MTYHIVPQRPNAILHTEAWTGGPNEGPGLASPSAMRRLADAMNYVSCRQKKLIMWRAQNFRAVNSAGFATTESIWPSFFRTGENTTSIHVYAGVIQTPFAAASPPLLRCNVFPGASGGAAVNASNGEGRITHNSASAGAVVNASEVSHKRFRITGLSPNTEYRMVNEVENGMGLAYLVVFESPTRHADDSVAGVCGVGKYQAQGPIYDEHIEDLVDANNRLWKHNGAHLLSWTADYYVYAGAAGVPRITTGTTYADVYTRDFYLATLYHNTRRRLTAATQVPVKMAIMGQRISGAGTLSVRLTDGTNNIEVTGLGTGGSTSWVTATGFLPAQLANYRLQAKHSDALTTHDLFGVSLFEYEA